MVVVSLIIGCSLSKSDKNRRREGDESLSSEIDFKSIAGENVQYLKNDNFIISVKKIALDDCKIYTGTADSIKLLMDTVEVEALTLWPVQMNLKRRIREQFEKGKVNVYSLKEKKYLHAAKKIVGGIKVKGVYANYTYIDFFTGDTILYTHSFDTGCPSF